MEQHQTEVIENTVKKLIYEISGEITDETCGRLKEDCGFDSLTIVSLIIRLEEEFGIQFDDSDLEPSALVTIADIIDLAAKYVQNTESGK